MTTSLPNLLLHSDLSLQRLRRAAKRSPLAIVRSEKNTMNFNASFFELGLDVTVVVVPIIRKDVVAGIDGNAVDGQSLNIFQTHSDQIPALELLGQAVDERFFANDGQPLARHGKHTIQMQNAFYKPYACHLIFIAQNIFQPPVAGLVGAHAGILRIADENGLTQHDDVAALQKRCIRAGGFKKLRVRHGKPFNRRIGTFFGQNVSESGYVHLANRRAQIEFNDVAADNGHVVPGKVLAEAQNRQPINLET